MTKRSKPKSLREAIQSPGLWFILLLLVYLLVVHNSGWLNLPDFLKSAGLKLSLNSDELERILFLAPIVWAGFIFGWKGALLVAFASLAAMLPRAFLFPYYSLRWISEVLIVVIVGILISLSFEGLRQERAHHSQLQKAERELQNYIKTIRDNEKRLTALNQVADAVSQSLELSEVLSISLDNVVSVMGVDVAWIFLIDESQNRLSLSAHRGIPEEFVRGVDFLKIGEGFSGKVAEMGKPLLVANASRDPLMSREVISRYNIGSAAIVPLSARGKVNGVLFAGMYGYRKFKDREVELLSAISSQISVAVENARLYKRQREIVEQLRTSEERYRHVFERAYDAIWQHDLDENIITANEAFAHLTGYDLEELHEIKASQLVDENSAKYLWSSGDSLPEKGEQTKRLSEVTVVRKDGSKAYAQLSTSQILKDGEIIGFQHIARDITEQHRLQENLHSYVQLASLSQEEERKRISRELHDDTIQELVVLSRRLDVLASNKELSEKDRRQIEALLEQNNNIIQGVRRLSQDLRPPIIDRLGLLSGLDWLANRLYENTHVKPTLTILGLVRRHPENVEMVLFRVTQEALSNIGRHAHATKAAITVEFGEETTKITIADNGQGFQLPENIENLAGEGRLGLTGMRERARSVGGNLTVNSAPSKGTSVTVEVPA